MSTDQLLPADPNPGLDPDRLKAWLRESGRHGGSRTLLHVSDAQDLVDALNHDELVSLQSIIGRYEDHVALDGRAVQGDADLQLRMKTPRGQL